MTVYKITLFKTKNKEWCWRIVHRNGKEIARASETYKRRYDCSSALYRMMASISNGYYVFEKDQ